jgi:hypothetical protein
MEKDLEHYIQDLYKNGYTLFPFYNDCTPPYPLDMLRQIEYVSESLVSIPLSQDRISFYAGSTWLLDSNIKRGNINWLTGTQTNYMFIATSKLCTHFEILKRNSVEPSRIFKNDCGAII